LRFDEGEPAKALPERRAKTILEFRALHHLTCSGSEIGKLQTLRARYFPAALQLAHRWELRVEIDIRDRYGRLSDHAFSTSARRRLRSN
jgi:hypothetical protein